MDFINILNELLIEGAMFVKFNLYTDKDKTTLNDNLLMNLIALKIKPSQKKKKINLILSYINTLNDLDINHRNNNNDTPLIFASEMGYLSIIKALLNKNAKINDINNNGDTALILSAFNDFIEVSKFLIESGADITIKNTEFKDAYFYALLNGNDKLIDLLSKLKVIKIKITKNKLESNLEKCPICLEKYTKDEEIILLKCCHNFHNNCINNSIRNKNTCPICRTILY